jgi:hypothetical protein
VKFAEVCPAGTFTTPGTWAAALLLVASVIEVPPEGAGELKVTVPVALVPPLTLAGVMETDCSKGGALGSGATLTKIDLVTPPALAMIFPPLGNPETGLVPIAKLTALLPDGMLTLGGMWITDGLSVLRVTVAPLAGASHDKPDAGAT